MQRSEERSEGTLPREDGGLTLPPNSFDSNECSTGSSRKSSPYCTMARHPVSSAPRKANFRRLYESAGRVAANNGVFGGGITTETQWSGADERIFKEI
jgi:hypothetical protein